MSAAHVSLTISQHKLSPEPTYLQSPPDRLSSGQQDFGLQGLEVQANLETARSHLFNVDLGLLKGVVLELNHA